MVQKWQQRWTQQQWQWPQRSGGRGGGELTARVASLFAGSSARWSLERSRGGAVSTVASRAHPISATDARMRRWGAQTAGRQGGRMRRWGAQMTGRQVGRMRRGGPAAARARFFLPCRM